AEEIAIAKLVGFKLEKRLLLCRDVPDADNQAFRVRWPCSREMRAKGGAVGAMKRALHGIGRFVDKRFDQQIDGGRLVAFGPELLRINGKPFDLSATEECHGMAVEAFNRHRAQHIANEQGIVRETGAEIRRSVFA